MSITLVKNIGRILSGNIEEPVLEGSCIVIKDGKIDKIGGEDICAGIEADQVIDAAGASVMPGLIDSHAHVTVGDYGHRQKTHDFIGSAMHGGVTTMISAGECHYPGRPKDPSGVKALAILAHKSFKNAPPSGVKVHAGSLILEKGLVEKDFEELAAEGVWTVGEVGLGSVKDPAEAAPMVAWAHKNGFKVMMHTGGTSIPGSSTVTAEMVIETEPDVVSHINGGPTAISLEEVDKIMDNTEFALEIVQCGNFKVADYVTKRAKEKGMLGRIIFGNDSPSGSGIMALGILRNIAYAACMSGVTGAEAVCMGSGNTARVYELNTSCIAPGKEADLVFLDAPMGSIADTAEEAFECGDLPGISIIMIDGVVKAAKSRNTPPAKRQAKVV
ncbi:MAG: amidohydrolase family protein [Fastidiosipilaceae bacterium]|nr:amidohydrolase family protein [Clostridiaceae bacterium]